MMYQVHLRLYIQTFSSLLSPFTVSNSGSASQWIKAQPEFLWGKWCSLRKSVLALAKWCKMVYIYVCVWCRGSGAKASPLAARQGRLTYLYRVD